MLKSTSSYSFYSGWNAVLIWLLLLLLTNPFSNYPLNDDWVYSGTVEILLHQGHFSLLDYCSSTILSQVLWSSLFCVFGFSFTALRISTIVLGAISILFVKKILTNSGVSEKNSFLITLLFCLNPLFFSNAATFMTDVPFLCFTLISLFYFLEFYRRDSVQSILPATVFSVIATLDRQLGVLLPLAAILPFLIERPFRSKSILKLIGSFLVVYCSLKLYLFLIVKIDGHLPGYFRDFTMMTGRMTSLKKVGYLFLHRIGVSSLYIGFFTLPLLLVGSIRQKLKWIHAIAFLFLLYCIAIVWTVVPIGNGINNFYISPITLNDVYFIRLLHNQTLPASFWVALKLIAASGALLFVRYILCFAKNPFAKKTDAYVPNKSEYLLVFYIAGYILLLVLSPTFLDRYLLPVIIVALLLLAHSLPVQLNKIHTSFFVFCIAVTGLFSVAGTHDYFQWNRERWKAVHFLTKEKNVPTTDIDGGYEFNGRNKYSAALNSSDGVSNWWITNSEKYLITMHTLPGTRVVKTYPYFQWLSMSEQTIYLLEKYNPDTYAVLPLKTIDFETDSTNKIQSFTAHNLKDEYSVTSAYAHSGRRSLKLSVRCQYNPESPFVELQQADYLFITCWCKIDSVQKLSLEISNKRITINIKPNVFKTVGDWKQLVFNRYIVPLDTMKNFTFSFLNLSDTNIYLDDIVIKKEAYRPIGL